MVWFPKRRFIRRYQKLLIISAVCIMLVAILILFGLIPLVFRYSYAIQRGIVFLNFVKWPPNPQYNNPMKYGLGDTRNFYITTHQDVKIGTWHVLPASLSNMSLPVDEDTYSEALGNGEPIVLYMHGNTGSRATGHRVDIYKILRKLDFHVIAIDYRGYADSSPVAPTEEGVVEDAVFVYKWITKRAKSSPIFVWGHSLGSGVSSHALAILSNDNIQSKGLILEAPFNNLRDEISEHPLAKFFKFLPWFEYFFVDPVSENMFLFETDKHLGRFQSPVLILHAEDDMIVPFVLGKRLYHSGLQVRKEYGGHMEFVKFDKHLKFGHKYICRSPLLPGIIGNFVSKYTQ